MGIYSIATPEEIVGYEDFVNDYNEKVKEDYKNRTVKMLFALFSYFSADEGYEIRLDSMDSKDGNAYRYMFDVFMCDNEVVVRYKGMS